MGATLKVWGVEATVENGEWTCDDELTQRVLNLLTKTLGRMTAFDPNPDYHLAQRVAKRFKGEVLKYDPTEYDPNVKY